MKKPLKFLWNLVTGILVAVVVLGALALAVPRLIGLRPFAVLSGSMEPTYHTGSLIYVRETEPEQIEVGDPITFVFNEDLVVATHRVVRIDAENQYFYTKGDANDAEDPAPVYFKNLIGKPVFSLPLMGYVSAFLSTKQGIIIAAVVVIAVVLMAFLPDLLRKSKKPEQAAVSDSESTEEKS